MKISIKKSLQSLLFVPALALGVSLAVPVVQPNAAYAQEECDIEGGLGGGVGCAGTAEQKKQGGLFGDGSIFQTITNTFLFIIGAVAVIMLIYGGFKYVTSAGDSSAVTSAKNTILYAVIGIVVALLAWAILDFVLSQFESGSGLGGNAGSAIFKRPF